MDRDRDDRDRSSYSRLGMTLGAALMVGGVAELAGCRAWTHPAQHEIRQTARDAAAEGVRALGGYSAHTTDLEFFVGRLTDGDVNAPTLMGSLAGRSATYFDLNKFDVKVNGKTPNEKDILEFGVVYADDANRDYNTDTNTFSFNYRDAITGEEQINVFIKDPNLKVRATGNASPVETLEEGQLYGWANMPESNIPWFTMNLLDEELGRKRGIKVFHGILNDNDPATKDPRALWPGATIRFSARDGYDTPDGRRMASEQLVAHSEWGAYVETIATITPKPEPEPADNIVTTQPVPVDNTVKSDSTDKIKKDDFNLFDINDVPTPANK